MKNDTHYLKIQQYFRNRMIEFAKKQIKYLQPHGTLFDFYAEGETICVKMKVLWGENFCRTKLFTVLIHLSHV